MEKKSEIPMAEKQVGRRGGWSSDSHVIAIQPHALTQKVNVGGLRIETDRCWTSWSRYRTADNAINQSVAASNRRLAVD